MTGNYHGSLQFISGVHPNPGPWKYPCGLCMKPVKKNQKGIACDICDSWYHIRCVHMDVPPYRSYQDNTSLEWYCDYCTLHPFTDSYFNESCDPSDLPSTDIHDSPLPHTCPKRANILSGCDLFTESKGFKIGHINVGQGGLLHHLEEIMYTINKLKPDILAVTETWLNISVPTEAVDITDYTF